MYLRVTRLAARSCSNGVLVTRVWSGDGWCYIPELKVRQKFLITEDRYIFEFVSENWNGIIPKPEHRETLMYYPESTPLLTWEESAEWGCDRYEQTTPSTQTSAHQPLELLPALQSVQPS